MENLTNPLAGNEVEWRIQSTTKDGKKTVVVPYIQNRAVMERFDKQFGNSGWRNEYQRWGTKGVLCGLSVYDSEKKEWITKWDGADETDIEATKGGLSDAMKRAAVQWGLGRELYQYPRVFLEGGLKFIPAWAHARLAAFVDAFNAGKLDRDMYVLSEKK